jgi:hypothetical protein
MGFFVKAVEAQDCFPFVARACHFEIEGHPSSPLPDRRWSTVMRIPACSIVTGALFLDKDFSFSIVLSPPSLYVSRIAISYLTNSSDHRTIFSFCIGPRLHCGQ